jgi:hypothetical protein
VAMEHLSKILYEAVKIACIDYKMRDIPLDLLLHTYKTTLLDRDRLYSTEDLPIYKPSSTHLKKNVI